MQKRICLRLPSQGFNHVLTFVTPSQKGNMSAAATAPAVYAVPDKEESKQDQLRRLEKERDSARVVYRNLKQAVAVLKAEVDKLDQAQQAIDIGQRVLALTGHSKQFVVAYKYKHADLWPGKPPPALASGVKEGTFQVEWNGYAVSRQNPLFENWTFHGHDERNWRGITISDLPSSIDTTHLQGVLRVIMDDETFAARCFKDGEVYAYSSCDECEGEWSGETTCTIYYDANAGEGIDEEIVSEEDGDGDGDDDDNDGEAEEDADDSVEHEHSCKRKRHNDL